MRSLAREGKGRAKAARPLHRTGLRTSSPFAAWPRSQAAIRETEEEIGLKLGDQNVFTLLGARCGSMCSPPCIFLKRTGPPKAILTSFLASSAGPLPDRPAVRSLGNVKLVVRTFIFLQTARETPKLKLSPHEVPRAPCPPPFPRAHDLRRGGSSDPIQLPDAALPPTQQVGAAWWVALGYICHPPKPLPVRQAAAGASSA